MSGQSEEEMQFGRSVERDENNKEYEKMIQLRKENLAASRKVLGLGLLLVALIATLLAARPATAGPADNARTWGWNWDGQLGDGTNTSSNTPVQVKNADESNLSGVEVIAGGGNHSLAVEQYAHYRGLE